MAQTRTEIQARYDAANRTTFSFKLHNTNDAEIIAKLRSVDSVNGYIRQLIKQDLAASVPDSAPKQYHIKPEYIDLWDSEATEETVITEKDVDRLANDWETPKEKLIEQLIPID